MKLRYFLRYYFHLSYTDRCKLLWYKWIKGVCRKPCITCNYMDDCWRNLIAELREQAVAKMLLEDEIRRRENACDGFNFYVNPNNTNKRGKR